MRLLLLLLVRLLLLLLLVSGAAKSVLVLPVVVIRPSVPSAHLAAPHPCLLPDGSVVMVVAAQKEVRGWVRVS